MVLLLEELVVASAVSVQNAMGKEEVLEVSLGEVGWARSAR